MDKMIPLFRTGHYIIPQAPKVRGQRSIFSMWYAIARIPMEPLQLHSENGSILTKGVLYGVRYDENDPALF